MSPPRSNPLYSIFLLNKQTQVFSRKKYPYQKPSSTCFYRSTVGR